jgi:hypothetical protein
MAGLTAFPLTALPFPSAAADMPASAIEARHVAATVIDATDRKFLTLDIRFGAALHNRTRADLEVAPKPIFLSSVDRLAAPEKWELPLTSSWYLTDESRGLPRPWDPAANSTFPRSLPMRASTNRTSSPVPA